MQSCLQTSALKCHARVRVGPAPAPGRPGSGPGTARTRCPVGPSPAPGAGRPGRGHGIYEHWFANRTALLTEAERCSISPVFRTCKQYCWLVVTILFLRTAILWQYYFLQQQYCGYCWKHHHIVYSSFHCLTYCLYCCNHCAYC